MHTMSQLFTMKFRRSMHAALRTISVYLKIKKIEEESSYKIQVSDANLSLIILTSL